MNTKTYSIEELHNLWDKSNQESKPHKRAAPHEHRLQVACLEWLHLAYPDVLCFAIPNGGKRNAIVAKRLKDEGVTAGIPDLCIPIGKHGYNALYIEMKNANRGVLSQCQKEMIPRLQSYGNKVVVCRTLPDFQREVIEYLK